MASNRRSRDAETAADLLAALVATPEGAATLRGILDRAGVTMATPAPDRLLYTVTDVAAQVGKSERTVRRLIASGELRASRRCGQWVITATDLVAWHARGVPTMSVTSTRSRSAGIERRDGLAALNDRLEEAA